MKALFALLTAAAVLLFLYFWFASATSFGRARAARKEASTELHRKELWARTLRSFFFCVVSGVAMVTFGVWYVRLKGGPGASASLNSPIFLVAPAMLHAASLMACFGSLAWLLFTVAFLAYRRYRGETILDSQRRMLRTSLRWSFGSLAILVLSTVILRNWQ